MKARPVRMGAMIATSLAATSAVAVAQDLPSDAQVQAAFGISYDRLGLIEYCADKGFATTTDVANARRIVAATTGGLSVGDAAKAQEAAGRRGDIVGPQVVGLMDASNPARPEVVPAGRTTSLADNARAQRTTERALCGQMAAQMAPLP